MTPKPPTGTFFGTEAQCPPSTRNEKVLTGLLPPPLPPQHPASTAPCHRNRRNRSRRRSARAYVCQPSPWTHFSSRKSRRLPALSCRNMERGGWSKFRCTMQSVPVRFLHPECFFVRHVQKERTTIPLKARQPLCVRCPGGTTSDVKSILKEDCKLQTVTNPAPGSPGTTFHLSLSVSPDVSRRLDRSPASLVKQEPSLMASSRRPASSSLLDPSMTRRLVRARVLVGAVFQVPMLPLQIQRIVRTALLDRFKACRDRVSACFAQKAITTLRKQQGFVSIVRRRIGCSCTWLLCLFCLPCSNL